MSGIVDRLSDSIAPRAQALQRGLASAERSPRMAVVIGRLVGLAMIVCIVTGVYSHLLQNPLPWLALPTRPVQLYAWSQGLHIAVGSALIPLLLAKLWVVYPRLFDWPPVRSIADIAERASIAVLVSTSLLQVLMGTLNTFQWYPWPFSFRATHWALTWVILGALLIHIAVKLPLIVRLWRRGAPDAEHPDTNPDTEPDAEQPDQRTATLRRRGFLIGVGASTGTLVVLTAGQSFAPLGGLNAFGPRVQYNGPQQLPVNKTAAQAEVTETAMDPKWTLTVTARDGTSRAFSRAELAQLPQTSARLPIACVEGWSTEADWTGVVLADLLDQVGIPASSTVRLASLQQRGGFRATTMTPEFTRDRLTLIALKLNGETLNLDHGYPARVIAPARSGVLQTKWLSTIEEVR